MARSLVVVALGWSVLVAVAGATIPLIETRTSAQSTTGVTSFTTSDETLLEREGASVLIALAAPIVAVGLVALVRHRALRRKLRIVLGVVLLVGCTLAAASIGVFYLPVSLLLVAAGVATPKGAFTEPERGPSPAT